MEIKSGEEKQRQYSKAKGAGSSWSSKGRNNIWDCGSTLYDSYELNSFKRQLDSAIANSPRALSMPHLPERRYDLSSLQRQLPQQQPPQSRALNINKPFKISRTLQKLLRFVFNPSNKSGISSSRSSNNSTNFQVVEEKYPKDRFYVVYDKCDEPTVLSTIPELPDFEIGGLSPEITALVRKSASERFTANAIGISCA